MVLIGIINGIAPKRMLNSRHFRNELLRISPQSSNKVLEYQLLAILIGRGGRRRLGGTVKREDKVTKGHTSKEDNPAGTPASNGRPSGAPRVRISAPGSEPPHPVRPGATPTRARQGHRALAVCWEGLGTRETRKVSPVLVPGFHPTVPPRAWPGPREWSWRH